MSKTRRYDSDDIDENGVLRDGGRLRVRLDMRDARLDPVQRAIASRGARLHDGYGCSDLVGHRPGHIVSDSVDRSAIADAYAEYERELTNAWRGHNRLIDAATREPGHPETGLTQDLGFVGHERAEVYAQYERELTNAWRRS